MSKLWFRAKTYGYGWYPITWQGWTVLGVYVVICVLIAALYSLLSPGKPQLTGLLALLSVHLVNTAILIWICVKKGERARWRWGNK